VSWPIFWSRKNWKSIALWPLSKLVCWEASRRYKSFLKHKSDTKQRQTSATLIVVGNVVVGGTGKTPFIVWLTAQLQQQGYSVGIISRGYGSKSKHWPVLVSADTEVRLCGDEPMMLAKQTGCAVAVSPKRVEAVQLLNETGTFDFIISDDGLQHFALQRDIEVVMIDAQRQFGNGFCMPSGPLREPLSRIADVDFTVWNGLDNNASVPAISAEQKSVHKMQLQPLKFCQVGQPENSLSLEAFQQQYPHQSVYAIAGIGNPRRFFNTLETIGLNVDAKAFADHHAYTQTELLALVDGDKQAFKAKPLVMTQKDAVKCLPFAKNEADWWYLQVEPVCDIEIIEAIVAQHQRRLSQ